MFKRLEKSADDHAFALPVVKDVNKWIGNYLGDLDGKGRGRKSIPNKPHVLVQLAEQGLEFLPDGHFFPSIKGEAISSIANISIPKSLDDKLREIQDGVKIGKYKSETRTSTKGQTRVYELPTLPQVFTVLMRLTIANIQKQEK